MVCMAKQPGAKKAKPTAIRLDEKLLTDLNAIGDRLLVRPNLTQLIEAACREFIEAHRNDPPQGRRGR
jgi:hypothetical protein